LLERMSAEAPEGLPRLEAAAVLALSGLCLDDSPKRRETGLKRLDEEIERQILPDGGHVSRSPQALLEAYRLVVSVMESLSAVGEEPPIFCAMRMTGWRRCCVFSVMATARWRCSKAARKAMRG